MPTGHQRTTVQANILLGASAVIGGPGIDLHFLRLRDRSTG